MVMVYIPLQSHFKFNNFQDLAKLQSFPVMETREATPRILMFPFLAHSHISSFLELAKTLSKNQFQIYFCSTPIILKTIIIKKLSSYSIQPVEIHLPSSPDLPPHYHTSVGLPPHLIFSLIQALEESAPIFSDILKSLQPDLVIYDTRQSWLPPIASLYGIPAILFQTTGATVTSFYLRSLINPILDFPSPGIFLRDHETSFRRVKSPSGDTHKTVLQFLDCAEQSTDILLIKTSREIEDRYIEFYSSLFLNQKKIIPLGALVKKPKEEEDDDNNHPQIIQWLSGKQKDSTVFVSFGSECYLTKEEFQEIAFGLELSNVNFIWVVRTPSGEKTSLEEILPKGFFERVEGRGLIVERWAPQAKILRHENVGGFVSHCGWGSLLESMSFAVPIIAVPMQYDQPVNARLVVEIGVGLEVVKGGGGKLNGVEVARIIKEVMLGDAGEGIRRRAKELADKVREKTGEEICEAVEELRRICGNNNTR